LNRGIFFRGLPLPLLPENTASQCSSMVVHIRKISDFGASEPWVARVWVGVLRFRDMVYFGDEQRLAFDQKFASVIDNLRECFQAMRLLHKAIADHEASTIFANDTQQRFRSW
jgi:hypothetical protein